MALSYIENSGSQISFEGGRFNREIQERGYAELAHCISTDQIEQLIEGYSTFTLNHPYPTSQTMSDMLPNTHVNLHKDLDLLDRTKDKQDTWHKYRTNAEGVGKPDGYTNRTLQEKALFDARRIAIPKEDPK